MLNRFGERRWRFPEESLRYAVNAYDAVVRANDALAHLHQEKNKRIKLPFMDGYGWYYGDIPKAKLRELESSRVSSVEKREGSHNRMFHILDSEVDGCEVLYFAIRESASLYEDTKEKIYGVPKVKKIIDDDERCNGNIQTLPLGEVDLHDLGSVVERRFNYIFGVPPADNKELINALVRLNHFPILTENGRDTIFYKLRECSLERLSLPRAVELVFDEARAAEGLFGGFKAYEVVGEVVTEDPVLVGLDHFGNRFPLIYWAGDKGLEE